VLLWFGKEMFWFGKEMFCSCWCAKGRFDVKEIKDVKALIKKHRFKTRFYSYEDVEDACYYMILNNEPSFSKALEKTGFLSKTPSLKRSELAIMNAIYEKNIEEGEKEEIEYQEKNLRKKSIELFGSNEQAKKNKKVLENLAKLKKLSRS